MSTVRTRIHPRESTVSEIDNGSGEVIRALSYRADYRAEEEYGIGDLRNVLLSTTTDEFFREQHNYVTGERIESASFSQIDLVTVTDDALVISVSPNPYRLDEHIAEGLRYIRDADLRSMNPDAWKYRYKSVAELRTIAKDAGISPLPRRKDDLVTAICEATTECRTNTHAAWFHHGKDLVFLRGTDDEYAEAVEKVIDAAQAGTLLVGSGDLLPFGATMCLLDSCEVSMQIREQIAAENTWNVEQMNAIVGQKDALRKEGYDVFSLGSPYMSREEGSPTVTCPYAKMTS